MANELMNKDLEERLLTETDPDELNHIIDLFNANFKKRDIIRISKLNDVQDKISTQIAERIDKKANEFSNKDLLDYFKVMQETITKSDTSIESIKPIVQVNQQNINITSDELSKESRDRVADAVKSILAKYSQPQETDYNIIQEEFEDEPLEENDLNGSDTN